MDNIIEDLVKSAFDPAIPIAKKEAGLKAMRGHESKEALEGFISVKDTMVFLGGISRVHLYQCRKKGLPSHNVGGRIVFSPQELRQWVSRNSKKE